MATPAPTGRQVISGPLHTSVSIYDVDGRGALLLDVPMSSVPRVGDIVETDSHGERYEVTRVVWIPMEHRVELHVRTGGA